MKKILVSSLATLAVVFLLSSCFKDKEYGVSPTSSPEGIAFPQSVNLQTVLGKTAEDSIGLNVGLTSSTSPQVDSSVVVSLESARPSTSDIHVKLAASLTVIPSAFTPFPASAVSIPLDVVIPAGKINARVPITFNNTSVLDPTLNYSLSLTLVSSDGGKQIATNSSKLFISYNIKNKYDGNYTSKWSLAGWAAYGIADGPTVFTLNNFNLVTSGPNSVIYDQPQTGDAQPGWTDVGALTVFGATAPEITFDPATNKVVNVFNLIPDDGRGRLMQLNPAVLTSAFDPATHNIFVSYILKQTGRPNMIITVNFTYVGPRG